MVKKSIFWGRSTHGYRGGWGELCEIFLTDLYTGYVAGKYELSKYSG